MKNYLTEFIGTFFLVLVIGLTAGTNHPYAPIAIGTVLMVMVYMGGHISGAHYNPAVTLGVWMRKKTETVEMVKYWVSQVAGALAGAAMSSWLIGSSFAPTPGSGVTAVEALAVEIVFTLALVLVVLNVAVSKATEGNSFYGAAIGLTILVAASAGGGISGGAFNPAVGVGPILVQAVFADGSWADIWIYILGPFAGAIAAVGIFAIQEPS